MASKVLVKSVFTFLVLLPLFWIASASTTNRDFDDYLKLINNSSSSLRSGDGKVFMDSYVLAFINYTYTNATHDVYCDDPVERARYGEGKIINAEGKFIHITAENDRNDHTGCSSAIRGTHGEELPSIGNISWIALVKRGVCPFDDKVKFVYNAGASGVVIYNDKESINLEKMLIKDKERNIAAVFTFKSIGEEIAAILDEGFDVYGSIIEGSRGNRPVPALNRTSVFFVTISFIILMMISLVWLLFYYIQRFRYFQTKDQQTRHLCSVTKRAIMKIPVKIGKTCDDKDNTQDCCPICIELYKNNDCIRVLPCKHEFHKNCIDPWLIEHRTCPMCKLDVLKYYGFLVGNTIVEVAPSPPVTLEIPIVVTPSTRNTQAISISGTNDVSSNDSQSSVVVVSSSDAITANCSSVPDRNDQSQSQSHTASRQVTDV